MATDLIEVSGPDRLPEEYRPRPRDSYQHVTITPEDMAACPEEAGELVLESLRVHAKGYHDEGFVDDRAIMPDGTLALALDKSRTPNAVYMLAVDPEDEENKATLRIVGLERGQTYLDLPSFKFGSDTLSDEGRRRLRELQARGAQIEELCALAKTSRPAAQGLFEIIRHVVQGAQMAEAEGGQQVALFFSVVTHTYDVLVAQYGAYNFTPLGSDFTIGDERVREHIALRPTLVMPGEFITNIARAWEDAEPESAARRHLERSLLHMTDGMDERMLSPRVTLALRQIRGIDVPESDSDTDGADALNIQSDLERVLQHFAEQKGKWERPLTFDMNLNADQRALEELVASGRVRAVVNDVRGFAEDLFEYRYPTRKGDPVAREAFVGSLLAQGARYGQWAYFPWSQTLQHYPPVEDRRSVHTSAYRELVTESEQKKLYDSRIAVFGLSVGSRIVDELKQSGIGGTFIMADPDHISASNLGRVRGTLRDLGTPKLDKTAQEVSESDPDIRQIHIPGGVTREGLEALSDGDRPQIIFDEVDDMRTKLEIRRYAQKYGIPVVMVTDLGDRLQIDVERYDHGNAQPFHGRLRARELAKLENGTATDRDLQKYTIKIVGLLEATAVPRLIRSVVDVDQRLGGRKPQLGTTAAMGGATGAIIAREILLGRRMATGRYNLSPRQALGLQRSEPIVSSIAALGSLARQSVHRKRDIH